MEEVLRFEFSFPLLKADIERVCTEVVRTRAHDGPVPALTNVTYLLRFSAKENSLRQNYTLAIAKPNEATEDNDSLWTKEQAWVVIKLKGGTGPRVNYMVTALGVARVNWKAGTRMFLGAVFPILDAEERFAQGRLFEGFGDDKEHPGVLYTRAQSLERNSSATALFGNVLQMSPEYVQSLLKNPQLLKDTASGLFSLFDEDRSGYIEAKEFLDFFMRFLQQSVEVTMALFQRQAQSTNRLTAEDFEALFRIFLQIWLEEKGEKVIVHMWSVLMELMSELPADKRNAFFEEQDTVNYLRFALGQLQASQGLQFPAFQVLEDGYDRAMYRPKRLEAKVKRLFEGLAVEGVIPVDVYFTHIRPYFSSMCVFLSQWETVCVLYDSIPCDSPAALLAWASSPPACRQLSESLFKLLNIGEKLNAEDMISFNRCCYSVPETFPVPEELMDQFEMPTETVEKALIEGASGNASEDIKCANFSTYKSIAALKREKLISLSIEKYRLKRIAKDQFSLTFPVRVHHDWETFRSYGQLLCEVFQVENAEETLQAQYQNFAEPEGLTEDGFVQVLKQMIGYQMKVATSKAIKEEQQLEGLRQLLSDEVALQSTIHQQFSVLDSDHDGLISTQDAKSFLNTLDTEGKGESAAEQLLAYMDRDKDGKVSFEDYYRCVVASMRQAVNS